MTQRATNAKMLTMTVRREWTRLADNGMGVGYWWDLVRLGPPDRSRIPYRFNLRLRHWLGNGAFVSCRGYPVRRRVAGPRYDRQQTGIHCGHSDCDIWLWWNLDYPLRRRSNSLRTSVGLSLLSRVFCICARGDGSLDTWYLHKIERLILPQARRSPLREQFVFVERAAPISRPAGYKPRPTGSGRGGNGPCP